MQQAAKHHPLLGDIHLIHWYSHTFLHWYNIGIIPSKPWYTKNIAMVSGLGP